MRMFTVKGLESWMKMLGVVSDPWGFLGLRVKGLESWVKDVSGSKGL